MNTTSEQHARDILQEAEQCWQKNPTHAKRLLEEALQVSLQLQNELLTADVLLLRSVVFADAREHENAERDARSALLTYKAQGSELQIAQALKAIATTYSYRSMFAESVEYCKQVLEIAERLNNTPLVIDMYARIGWDNHSQNIYAEALEYFNKALALAKEINDEMRIASCMADIAAVLTRTAKLEDAIVYLQNALAIYEKLDFQRGRMRCISDLALIYARLHDYATALQMNFQALEIAEKIQLTYSQAVAFTNIAVVYYNLFDLAQSVVYLKKALAIHELNNDPLGIATNLSNIVVIYTELKDYNDAIEFAERGLEISKKINSKDLIALNYANLSTVYVGVRNYNKALECAEESLRVHRELGYTVGVINSLINKGAVLQVLNKYSEAESCFTEVLPLLQEAQNIEAQTKVYLGLSTLFATKEWNKYNPEQSEAWLLDAEKINTNTVDRNDELYYKLSEFYEQKQEYNKALEYIKKANAIHNEVFSGETAKQVLTLRAERELAAKEKQRLIIENEREVARKDAEIYRLEKIELAARNKTIEEQNEQLRLKQEQLNTSNNKLRQAIADLATLTASRKARTYFMMFMILLFVFSEVVVEPIIQFITSSVIVGMLLRFGIGLLFRPIEAFAEHLTTKKQREEILDTAKSA